jgi:hypothetical protein
MKYFTTGSLWLVSAALLATNLFAATTGLVIKPVASVTIAIPNDAEFRRPISDRAVRSFHLNTVRFDALSIQLDLSTRQQIQIQHAKTEIVAEALARIVAQALAQQYLDKSVASGADQTRELRQATKSLESYDAGSEFARRIWEILSPAQTQTYLRIAAVNVDVAKISDNN